MSLTDNVTISSVSHIFVVCGSILTFFAVLSLDEEAISDGFMAFSRVLRRGGVDFKGF